MKYVLIISVIATLFFQACRPENIDINVDPAPPKLVVFSHVIPNDIMIVSLTKSFSALQPQEETKLENLLVGGADVTVKYGNETASFYELEYGLYASIETPTTTGINYEFTAIKGNDTITAESVMLEKTEFESVTPVITKTSSDTTTEIQVKFTDNAAEENWYLINVYKKDGLPSSGAIDNVNFFGNGSNVLAKSVLLSDKEIPGTYDERLLLNNVRHDDSIVVTLSNIDEQYYNYLNLRLESGNLFTSLNLEPVNYPTNVQNGYGFFNTHYPAIRFYDLSEF